MVPAQQIIETARDEQADLIGLSGLITPSLDEMVQFAGELQRREMDLPLLIGGATTSRVHTAVRIAPRYAGPVVYVQDASRAVGVAANLLSPTARDEFIEATRRDYEEARDRHLGRPRRRRATVPRTRPPARRRHRLE